MKQTTKIPRAARRICRSLATMLAGTMLVAMGLAAAPVAAAVPEIAVDFHLDEETFRLSYSDEDIARLEALVVPGLARILGEELPYLSFIPNGDLPDRLDIRLGQRTPETTVRPVYFWLTVAGPSIAGEPEAMRTSYSSEDRPAELPPAEIERFRDTILERFGKNLNPRNVTSELLSAVVLTREAFALDESDGWFWILPFSLAELGIEVDESVFLVRANLTLPERLRPLSHKAKAYGEVREHPEVPEIYRRKLMALVTGDPALLEELRRSESQQVVEIRLIDFKRLLENTLEPVTPSSLTLNEEDSP